MSGSILGRPSFRLSDIWKAPLNDLPIRDELLYQYLPLSREMTLLEIGPGSGFTAFRLSRHVNSLTLVDIGADTVAQLRQTFKDVPNLRVVCADVCQPGLAQAVKSRFDAAFGLEVFELLPDPGACLQNLADVLRPDGNLLLQFPNYPPPRNPGVTFFRTRETLDELMLAAGFRRWEVYGLDLRWHAQFVYREFHDRPLSFYRRFRRGSGEERSLTYDNSWAFQQRQRLERHKYLLHGIWAVLLASLRAGGPCFKREALGEEILNRNLLVMARR